MLRDHSSSVHSITMCSKDDFKKWKNLGYYFYYPCGKPYVIGTREQMIKLLKSKTWSNGTPVYSDIDWVMKNLLMICLQKKIYLHLMNILTSTMNILKHCWNIILPQKVKKLLLLAIVAMMVNT